MNGPVRIGTVDWFVLDLPRLTVNGELLQHREQRGTFNCPCCGDHDPLAPAGDLLLIHDDDCTACWSFNMDPWHREDRDF